MSVVEVQMSAPLDPCKGFAAGETSFFLPPLSTQTQHTNIFVRSNAGPAFQALPTTDTREDDQQDGEQHSALFNSVAEGAECANIQEHGREAPTASAEGTG